MKKLLILTSVLFMVLAGCTSAKKEEDRSLIVYTNSGSSGRTEWLTEYAKNEGNFDLNVLHIPGGDLTNRILAEKNNQIADVVFGLNAVEYEKIKKENLLLKFTPDWADEVDSVLGDKDGYYYPIVVQPLVLMYNKDAVTDIPSDWTDLVDAKYNDKYTVLALGGGTSKSIISSLLIRYKDANGEFGISQQGWDFMKAFIQNGHLAVTGEDIVGNLVGGSVPMSMYWGSGVLQEQAARKVTFGIMTPEVGMPYVVEQVAIFSKGKKTDLALEFANWFGSAEVQAAWSAEFGSTPANEIALEEASKEVKDFMAITKPQDIDWKFVAENIDKWMEKIQLEFVK